MKKVFSVKKWEEWMIQIGVSKNNIEISKETWANKCDGLTAEEMMVKHGCLTRERFMIEVDEINNKIKELEK